MAILLLWEVVAGVGNGAASSVKAIGIVDPLAFRLQRQIVSYSSFCYKGGIIQESRTVVLSQLIQRGIMMLDKLIAAAVMIG